jgi:hypothetical protein
MRMDQLLEKLELEALDEWDKTLAKRSQEKSQLIFTPVVRTAHDRKRILLPEGAEELSPRFQPIRAGLMRGASMGE